MRGPASPVVQASIARADVRRLNRGPLITPPPGKPRTDIELPPTPTEAREIKSARMPSGGVRDLSKLHNDALMREYAERAESMLDAATLKEMLRKNFRRPDRDGWL